MGAARPLWPFLLALAALVLVADVGIRRVRVTGPEIRGVYVEARRRLGYVDQPTAPPVPTVDYFYDWCCGDVVPCDQPHLLSASHQPPTRPPCC